MSLDVTIVLGPSEGNCIKMVDDSVTFKANKRDTGRVVDKDDSTRKTS